MAAKGWQRVLLFGNLGRDPILRTTQSGVSVANLSVAVNDRAQDASGNWHDKTDWFTVVVWDKVADFCGRYLTKGSTVFVEGRLTFRTYQDKEGVERSVTEVKAWNVCAASAASRPPAPPGTVGPDGDDGSEPDGEDVPF